MDSKQDPLEEIYSEISPQFEARTLTLMADYEEENLTIPDNPVSTSVITKTSSADTVVVPFSTAKNYNLVISLASEEIQKIVEGYLQDPFFSRILSDLREESN